MVLLIDTAMVPARERLDFWLESSTDSYLPVHVRSRAKEQFGARMWGHGFGPISFFRIAAAANTMMRTPRAIAACDPECLHLTVVLRGRMEAVQDGRTGIAGMGDVISYDTSHPMVFRANEPFESLVVRVPMSILGRDADRISKCTALRIAGSEGVPRAAVAFFRGLVSGLEDGSITADDAPNTIECVVDLVRGMYAAPPARTAGPKQVRSRPEILRDIQSFIAANLGNPDLDPEGIARASFISTRYLHKLFEAEGTSVCQWIRTSRLERCRRDLLDPARSHLTILAIASRWGLPGPQHFSRLFREAYGCSPSELRRRALSP
jgi:AraC-like DNA-binding protein